MRLLSMRNRCVGLDVSHEDEGMRNACVANDSDGRLLRFGVYEALGNERNALRSLGRVTTGMYD